MAGSTPVKYEDLPDELKKKHHEIKATLEAELIGSFEKARAHGNTRLLPGDNMVDLSHSICQPEFSFGVNMAGFASRHGKDEAESSHSRGKETRRKPFRATGSKTMYGQWGRRLIHWEKSIALLTKPTFTS